MTEIAELQTIIDEAFEARDNIDTGTGGQIGDAVEEALNLLDGGKARVAEKVDGVWTVNQWLKKAVLLSFRLKPMDIMVSAETGSE